MVRAAAYGVPDAALCARVKAVVVTSRPVDVASLQSFTATRWADYEVPALVGEFPHLPVRARARMKEPNFLSRRSSVETARRRRLRRGVARDLCGFAQGEGIHPRRPLRVRAGRLTVARAAKASSPTFPTERQLGLAPCMHSRGHGILTALLSVLPVDVATARLLRYRASVRSRRGWGWCRMAAKSATGTRTGAAVSGSRTRRGTTRAVVDAQGPKVAADDLLRSRIFREVVL